MRKTYLITTSAIALFAIIALTSVAIAAAGSTRTADVATIGGTVTPKSSPAVLPPGMPGRFSDPPPTPRKPGAIPDTYGAPMLTPTLTSSDLAAPLFTEQNVRSYFANVKNLTSPAPSVEKVSFLNIGAIRQSSIMDCNFSDDQPVCAVQFTGKWNVHEVTYTKQYYYFSSRSGNLIGYTWGN